MNSSAPTLPLSPLAPTHARMSFLCILTLRSLFFCLVIFALNPIIEFGSNPYLLSVAVVLGTCMGSWIAFQRVRLLATLVLVLLLYLVVRFGFAIISASGSGSAAGVLFPFTQLLHFNLALAFFLSAYLSSWIFWKAYHTVTLEIIGFSAFVVYLFSGHRDFRFSDAPRLVSEMAWVLGTDHLTVLVLLGTAVTLLLLLYLSVATLPWKPRADWAGRNTRSHIFSHRIFGGLAIAAVAFLLIGTISRQIFFQYYESALSRGSNGVGLSAQSEEAVGKSPLGFHSALGSNSQPAGLVRLDGDYSENPFSPMLYLREGALSLFDGHEMVDAGKGYDDDISYTAPNKGYTHREDQDLLERVPVVQSFYLLTNHKTAFALDYPLSITRLVNPAPEKFRAVYKAYSLAPSYSREELNIYGVGDPRWSEEKRKHYLATHSDARYGELADEITLGLISPVDKAFALVDYLSKTAIYTLTPKHDIAPNEDPVAPFLFGDKRGYCVHFAHATVYMLRSLGIPARIATGYLTDLSQSKDGHILLRMSDRHAWAEAYITEKGWVPFDTQPEQVESHAETQVDMQLLEELMGLVGPGEEVFDDDLFDGETGIEEPVAYPIPGKEYLIGAVFLLLFVLLALKLYLRFGWILPASPHQKLRRSYQSLVSLLTDLGYERRLGETRKEFVQRLYPDVFQGYSSLTKRLNSEVYREGGPELTVAETVQLRQADIAQLAPIPWWKRVFAFCNPLSAVTLIFRRGW